MTALTYDEAVRVWAVLVEECGAQADDHGSMWLQFVHYVTRDERNGHEFRFMGSLGFGGKFLTSHGRRWSVTCYPEDRSPKRDEMIERANARLGELAGAA